MAMSRLTSLLLSGILSCLTPVAHDPATAQQADWIPQPPAAAAPKDDGQWLMPSKNYASTRYSELADINAGNVGGLQVAFTFSTGVNRGMRRLHSSSPRRCMC